jgi:hypothetical protein
MSQMGSTTPPENEVIFFNDKVEMVKDPLSFKGWKAVRSDKVSGKEFIFQ